MGIERKRETLGNGYASWLQQTTLTPKFLRNVAEILSRDTPEDTALKQILQLIKSETKDGVENLYTDNKNAISGHDIGVQLFSDGRPSYIGKGPWWDKEFMSTRAILSVLNPDAHGHLDENMISHVSSISTHSAFVNYNVARNGG